MLQTLLGERFRLVMHRETRQMPVYFLTISKQDAQLREQKDGQPPPASNQAGISLTTKMDRFIAFISSLGHIDRPVVDKIGLDGVLLLCFTAAPGRGCEGSRGRYLRP
jgi:uncharacterized protein (TIGR03435 family)